MMPGGITFIQVVSFIVTIVCIVIILLHGLKDKSIRYIAVLMLIWLMHSLIFYGVIILIKYGVIIDSSIKFSAWSSILRWHSLITVLTMLVTNVYYKKTMRLG